MVSIYGTIALADTYFGERLVSGVWENSIAGDRTKALIMATRAVDRLNFADEKTDSDQELQFPRGTDTEIPADILLAVYECAISFLDGVDIDLEQELLGVTSDAYSGARATYDPAHRLDHFRAGIPSSRAWQFLMPYLRDPQEVTIRRVS